MMRKIKSTLVTLTSLIFLFWFSFAGNPFVRNLLWTQLEIWLNQRSNVGKLRWGESKNALLANQESSNLNRYDLISELDKAKDEQERLKVIDNYIVLLKNSVSNGTEMYNYEQSQVNYYNSAAKECEAPIKSKNTEFSEAIKAYNYDKAESVAQEIAELRACVARNEVFAKAHASYASAAKWLGSLQSKADYLSKNREKIAKYYEILKPDLLKELYDISKTVENNF